MSGQLQLTDGDPPEARCAICGAKAVGPCARCEKPTCGDCCVLTERSAKTWALCLRCADKGDVAIRSGWWIVAMWIALPTVGLAALLALLVLVTHWLRG